VATATDPNARWHFSLATGASGFVEFSDLALRTESKGRDGKAVIVRAGGERFSVSYRFNSHGFRGPDPLLPRPAGTYRILALGDSYTLGVGVHERDTFAVQLESRLNAVNGDNRGDTVYEVINGGGAGYGAREELMSYETHSSLFDAQLVLLSLVWNDDLSNQDELTGSMPTSDFTGLSRLWTLTGAVRRRAPTHDYSDVVLAVRELNEACARRGARLAVVIFTNFHSAAWDQLAREVSLGLTGTGVPMVNLKEALVSEHRRPEEMLVHELDHHPNERAHRIAAEEIERFLRREGLLPS
jgi:hypothetical protein